MLGAQSLEQILGTSLMNMVQTEERKACQAFLDRAMGGQRGSFEVDLVGLTGSRHTLELHANAHPGAPDAIASVLISFRDVTESRRLEHSLVESATRQAEQEAAHDAERKRLLTDLELARKAQTDQFAADEQLTELERRLAESNDERAALQKSFGEEIARLQEALAEQRRQADMQSAACCPARRQRPAARRASRPLRRPRFRAAAASGDGRPAAERGRGPAADGHRAHRAAGRPRRRAAARGRHRQLPAARPGRAAQPRRRPHHAPAAARIRSAADLRVQLAAPARARVANGTGQRAGGPNRNARVRAGVVARRRRRRAGRAAVDGRGRAGRDSGPGRGREAGRRLRCDDTGRSREERGARGPRTGAGVDSKRDRSEAAGSRDALRHRYRRAPRRAQRVADRAGTPGRSHGGGRGRCRPEGLAAGGARTGDVRGAQGARRASGGTRGQRGHAACRARNPERRNRARARGARVGAPVGQRGLPGRARVGRGGRGRSHRRARRHPRQADRGARIRTRRPPRPSSKPPWRRPPSEPTMRWRRFSGPRTPLAPSASGSKTRCWPPWTASVPPSTRCRPRSPRARSPSAASARCSRRSSDLPRRPASPSTYRRRRCASAAAGEGDDDAPRRWPIG